MKYEWVFLGVCLCACGSGDDTDAGTDATTGNDAAADQANDQSAGDTGSDAQDAGSDVVDSSVPDGFSFECTTPTQCDSGYCCGSLTTGAGTFPNCPLVSGNSKCTTTCASNAALSCSSTSTIRMCSKKSDCNEPFYAECCTFQDGGVDGGIYYLCINALAKSYAAGCL